MGAYTRRGEGKSAAGHPAENAQQLKRAWVDRGKLRLPERTDDALTGAEVRRVLPLQGMRVGGNARAWWYREA